MPEWFSTMINIGQLRLKDICIDNLTLTLRHNKNKDFYKDRNGVLSLVKFHLTDRLAIHRTVSEQVWYCVDKLLREVYTSRHRDC